MSNLARHWILGWLMGGTLTVTSAAVARDWNAASLHYGEGVHAYFAGRYGEAERHLTEAIESSLSDPRPFYFRAMSRLKMGWHDNAREDMQLGAMFEARRPQRFAVGKALERVQGTDRLVLEKYRQQARLAEAARQGQRSRTRYEPIQRQGSDILRQPVDTPLEQLAQPVSPRDLRDGSVPSVPPDASLDSVLQTPPGDDPFTDDAVQPEDSELTVIPENGGPASDSAASDDDPFAESFGGETPDQEAPAEVDRGATEDSEDPEDPLGGF